MTVYEQQFMETVIKYLPRISTSLSKIEQHLDLIKDIEMKKLEEVSGDDRT